MGEQKLCTDSKEVWSKKIYRINENKVSPSIISRLLCKLYEHPEREDTQASLIYGLETYGGYAIVINRQILWLLRCKH